MKFQTTYDSSTKSWFGPPPGHKIEPNLSIATLLLESLSRNAKLIGQINANNGAQLTNEQIRLNAVRLAINLKRGHLRVRKDDVIALASKNHEKVSAVVFAAFALAAPINTLDPYFSSDEFEHMLGITRPSMVFSDSDSFPKVRLALLALNMNIPIVTVDLKVDGAFFVDDLLVPQPDEQLFVPSDVEDSVKQTAIIICSSGTTGLPKGVRISHAMLVHQYTQHISYIKPDDVCFSFSSLFWLTEILQLVNSSLFGIRRIQTTCPFDAELFLTLIERYGVTIAIISPFFVAQLLKLPAIPTTKLTTIRRLLCGGSPISNVHFDQFNTILPAKLSISYSTSEFGGIISVNHNARIGSVGTLNEGVSARIFDEHGNQCGPNEDGEIFVFREPCILGYWNDTVATADAIDSAGWFRTGDVGHFDDEGYLYVIDRKKDIMRCYGHCISPSELENVILQCPGVAHVCVAGIWDDENSAELPAALVIKTVGHDVTREDIEAIVKDKLGDAKQLRGGVYFAPEFPVSSSGKVIRRKVRNIIVDLRQKL